MTNQIPVDQLSFNALDELIAKRRSGTRTAVLVPPSRVAKRKPTDQELVLREAEDLEAIVARLAKIMDSPQWIPSGYVLKTSHYHCSNCGFSWITTEDLYLKSRNKRNTADWKLERLPDNEGLLLEGLQLSQEHSHRTLAACHRCWPTHSHDFIGSLNNDY